MKKEVEEKDFQEHEIKKSLSYSTKDGVASTITGNAGDNFVSAYAVALGATNFQIGLLSALPNLLPVEIFTTKLIGKISRKKIVVSGVMGQIILLLLMATLGFFMFKSTAMAATLLIVLFTLYASTGLFISPAWNSWMKDLTEKIEIGKYFGVRNRIFGIVGLITLIIAGIVLNEFKKLNIVFYGFALLFVVAALARTISRGYLKKQYEPKLKLKKESYFSFWQFVKKAYTNNYGRFVIFIALINLATTISGPFFTPYLLNSLKFNYITFTIINLVISALAALLTMPLWGKFLDKYGCVATMRISVWAIPVIPLLWLISPSPYWLAVVQIFSGTMWAGFNLAAGTFIFHAVTKERMNLCVAYSSILNGVAIFFGAIIGGILASLNIKFMNVFLFVFFVSGIVRIIIISVFFPLIKEVRQVKSSKPLMSILLKPFRELHALHASHPFSRKANH